MTDPKNADKIQSAIKDYIMNNSNFDTSDTLDIDDKLLEDGILDSLGIAEITEFMEEAFNFEVEEDEITADNYRTLGTLTEFCQSKLASNAA